MKKALSLVEVLIAIVLLTVIISVILQIQQNNIFFLEKFKNNSLYNSYISLIVTSNENKLRNENIYLSDKVNLNDDDIRKEFKEIKINIKDIEDKDIDLPKNDYIKTAKIIKSIYTIEDKSAKTFYTFKLQ